jgi:hypothetical protein
MPNESDHARCIVELRNADVTGWGSLDALDRMAVLQSLEHELAALRDGELPSVEELKRGTVLAELNDSSGSLPISASVTSGGLRLARPDSAANATPPEMLWPLDAMVDESIIADWRSATLAVDFPGLDTDAEFFMREYSVDVRRLYANYREEWSTWASRQRRMAEGIELFEALRELVRAASGARNSTHLAAWRFAVPSKGIDTYLVRRSVRLELGRAPTATSVLAGASKPAERLGGDEVVIFAVDESSSVTYDLSTVEEQLGIGEIPRFRPNLPERNDLPLGSHVRQRVLSDIHPALADSVQRSFGREVAWSLTMSPALMIGGRQSIDESARRLVADLRPRFDEWPALETAVDEVLDGVPGSVDRLQQRISEVLRSSDAETDNSPEVPAGPAHTPTGGTGRFRDRLRTRSALVDPLTRFRDRRRAGVEARVVDAPAQSPPDGVPHLINGVVDNESLHATGPLTLDEQQLSIVEASPSDRVVVVAGAGQGKTEVVAARLEFLAVDHELSLSTDVLVLSFSRAAVSAVRKRLATRELAHAEIRTFDSFAARIIIDAEQEPVGTFDARIEHATRLLLDDDIELPILDDIQHVVLDEVQDLVGKRAKLAMALISRVGPDVGFTALGDPNQALYDFQLTDAERADHTEIVGQFGSLDGVTVTHLTRNFRARGPIPLTVVDLGQRLRTMTDGKAARELVDRFIGDLSKVSAEIWLSDVYSAGRTTAVLTKTNGDALRVSQLLTALEVRHSLRRPSKEQGASAWVSELARLLPRAVNRRDDVITALQSTSVADPEVAWGVLKEAEGIFRSPDDLDMTRIRRVIGGYGIPSTLLADSTEDVVVSTVHRAKGLEFDRVFFLDTDWESDQDDFAVARRNYVALSRARDEIRRCASDPAWARMKKAPAPPGRWTETGWAKGRKQVNRAIEFLNGDIATDIPFSTDETESVHRTQALLASGLAAGRPVTLELDTVWSNKDEPVYLVRDAEGVAFARTDEEFGRNLKKLFTIYNSAYPMVLHGATVMTVESVTGSPEVCSEAGLGESGIWLAPRLAGLVRPQWDTKWDGTV